ncbi:uncharacterized protein LOC143569639 [Bidens hawaiensis]|uniref:uncharacterized protein LOC143569639 n=1 Tax=Bidens hawaiensis TaxID=980011 RepID=UPI00404B926C
MDIDEGQNSKFLELLKQLHLNVPFLEALTQMPKYAKFLKDILTNKQKLAEVSSVPLSAGCSAILQSKLLEKMADPGSFTIPCILGDNTVSHALADLGASINLMPYSIFSRLGLGEPRPTRMSIQLADRSVKYPRGIVENMLARIGKFIFPVDYVILDVNEDDSVPLIPGRPFLTTTQALIDVRDGKLILRVGDENITFNVQQSLKHPKSADDSLYFIDRIMTHVGEFFSDICGGSTSDTQILDKDILEVKMVAMTEQPSDVDAESSFLDSDLSIGDHLFHQLEELRDHTYAHSYSSKQWTKELHDCKLKGNRQFKCRNQVLLYNSRLWLFLGKLNSRRSGPFTITEVFPYGTIEIEDESGKFKVNGHRLKHYVGETVAEQTAESLYLDALTE